MKYYDIVSGTKSAVYDSLNAFISGMMNVDAVVLLFETRQMVRGKSTLKYDTKSVDLDAKRRGSKVSGYSSVISGDEWMHILCEQGHLVMLLSSSVTAEVGACSWTVNPICSRAMVEDNGCLGRLREVGSDSYDLLLHYPGTNTSFYYGGIPLRRVTNILRDLDRMPDDWVISGDDDRKFLEEQLDVEANFFLSRGKNVVEEVNTFLTELGQYTKHAVINRTNVDENSVIDFETRRSLHLIPSMKDNMIDVMCPCESSFGREMFKDWITNPLSDVDTVNNRLATIHRLSLDPDGLYERIGKLDEIISRINVSVWNYVWRVRPIRDIGYLRKVYSGINNMARMLYQSRHYEFLDADADSMRFTINRVHTVIWDDFPCEPTAPDDSIFVVHWTTETIDECIKEALENIMKDFKARAKAFNPDLDISRVRYDTNNTGILVPSTAVWCLFLDSIECGVTSTFGSCMKISLPELDEAHTVYVRTYQKFFKMAMIHTEKILKGMRETNAGVHDLQVGVRRVLRFLGHEEVMLKLALQLHEGGMSIPRFHNESKLSFRCINLPNPDDIRVSGRTATLSTYSQYGTANTVTLQSTPVTMVTGSTGSGKSLFLRMVGINVVRAMCGMPVYCDSMRLPFFDRIYMHAGISDSLERGVSSFKREIMRVNMILDCSPHQRMLVLTDELFQTTRENVGQELLTRFIDYLNVNCPRAIAALSTHHMIKPKINRCDVVFDKEHKLGHGSRARYDNVLDILKSMDLMEIWDHDVSDRISAKRLRSI